MLSWFECVVEYKYFISSLTRCRHTALKVILVKSSFVVLMLAKENYIEIKGLTKILTLTNTNLYLIPNLNHGLDLKSGVILYFLIVCKSHKNTKTNNELSLLTLITAYSTVPWTIKSHII